MTVNRRCQALGIDEGEFEECVFNKMSQGISEEKAQKECETELVENNPTGKGEPIPASDNLGIVGREATPLERCMGCRIDIYGDDEETARKTCTKMFNDPMYKHVFTEGDNMKIVEVLHEWSLWHDPQWALWREHRSREQRYRERAIDKIIMEIQSNAQDPDRFDPAESLRKRAERIYETRKGKGEADVRREERESRLTVGDLFNKTKEQRIRDQHKPGNKRLTAGDQFGKTRAQICAEIGEDLKIEDKLRKLKRKEGKA